MKRPKTLIRIGAVLLVVVATLLVVRAVLNDTEGRALTRALAALKAKGAPLTARELAPSCPEEDNAARLWTAAENLLNIDAKQGQGLLARCWTDYSSGRPLAPGDEAALRALVAANDKALELIMRLG